MALYELRVARERALHVKQTMSVGRLKTGSVRVPQRSGDEEPHAPR